MTQANQTASRRYRYRGHTFTGPRHTISEIDAELGEPHTGADPTLAPQA